MGRTMPGRRLRRSDLKGQTQQVIAHGCCYAADVLLYEVGGERIVLKDFLSKPALWRNTIGRILVARETGILMALEGMEGVPQFRGRPDPYSVAMTYVPGSKAFFTYRDMPMEARERFIGELERIVAQMHKRGVVHLDLRHRTNLLVTPQGQPVVMDFASGLRFDQRSGIGRLGVRLLAWIDKGAVIKWKRRLCPHLLTAAEKRQLSLTSRLADWLVLRKVVNALLHSVRDEQ